MLSDGRSFVIAAIAGAAVVLILFGMLFLLLRKGKKKSSVQVPVELPASPEKDVATLAEQTEQADAARLEARQEAQRQLDQEIANQLKLPTLTSKKGEILVKHIREMVQKDNVGTTNVVRTWLTEKAEVR